MRDKEKVDEMRKQILAIIPGQTIKIKVGSAIQPSTLVNVNEADQTVEVEWVG